MFLSRAHNANYMSKKQAAFFQSIRDF